MSYRNGLANGIWKLYNENGALCSETPFKKGKVSGIIKLYHENGKPILETPFSNGTLNGTARYYFYYQDTKNLRKVREVEFEGGKMVDFRETKPE